MITEDDLKAAIAHYRGENNPDINTCIKLAACLICLKEEQGDVDSPSYSYAAPVKETVDYYSETEFGEACKGKETSAIMRLMDELMTTLSAIQPRLYDGVMRRLRDI